MATSPFRRVFVIVIDSLGVGELPDAAAYGDEGSNTLGNIAARRPLRIPHLHALGISRVVALAGMPPADAPLGAYGRMAEVSPGKDSVTGHWELMGLQLEQAFPTFPAGFPDDAMREFERRIGRPTLGNVVASGTQIIEDLGPEHLRTGWPIIYTSADSVFQIAAHEDVIPVPELYRMCEIAYAQFVEGMGLGRVIARPFVGTPGSFRRTANRHDYAILPAADTLLDLLTKAGVPVLSIGKIKDLFAGRGISRVDPHRVGRRRAWMPSNARSREAPARARVRESRRFRRDVRPPQRHGRLRRQPRAVRRAARPAGADARATTTCSS